MARSRPGRPTMPPGPGGDGLPPGSDWFPVHLTDQPTPGRYTGHEVWVDPDDDTVEAVGTRVLTAEQPGVFLDGSSPDVSEDAPVLALARLGPGAGGRVWELFAGGGDGGGGSNPGAPCSGPGLLAGATKHDCWVLSVTDGNGNMADINQEQVLLLAWDDAAGGWVSTTYFCTCLSRAKIRLTRGHEGDPKLEIVGLGVDGPCPGGCDDGVLPAAEAASGYAGDYTLTFHCSRGRTLYFKGGNSGAAVLCCDRQAYSQENTFTVAVALVPGCAAPPTPGCASGSNCMNNPETACELPGVITATIQGAPGVTCPDGDLSWADGLVVPIYYTPVFFPTYGPAYRGTRTVAGGTAYVEVACVVALGIPKIRTLVHLTGPGGEQYCTMSSETLPSAWGGDTICDALADGPVTASVVGNGSDPEHGCDLCGAGVRLEIPADGGGSGSGPLPDGCGSGGECLACQDGDGDALEGHPQLEFVVPDGPAAGTYTFSWDEGSGWYVQDGGGAGYVKCLTDSGDPSIGVWTVQLEVADGMEVDLYGPANAVTTSECGSAFGLTLDGPTFGSGETPTVGVA